MNDGKSMGMALGAADREIEALEADRDALATRLLEAEARVAELEGVLRRIADRETTFGGWTNDAAEAGRALSSDPSLTREVLEAVALMQAAVPMTPNARWEHHRHILGIADRWLAAHPWWRKEGS